MNLQRLNQMSREDAYQWFYQTCASSNWCSQMTDIRPFDSEQSVLEKAQFIWSEQQEKDYLEAFEGHPMIGDLASLKKKYADTATLAAGEQQGTSQASESTLIALEQANKQYLEQNGFIFIICATGLSARTMLNNLQERLNHSRDEEIQLAAEQQIKITLLRITKALSPQQQKVNH